MDVERRLEVVEQENLLLRERIAFLEAILIDCVRLPVEWGLTQQETRVFGTLVNREVATKDAVMAALYSDRAGAEGEVEPKIVDVFVCKIRKKLKPFGIEIRTVWGQGYALKPDIRSVYRTAKAAA